MPPIANCGSGSQTRAILANTSAEIPGNANIDVTARTAPGGTGYGTMSVCVTVWLRSKEDDTAKNLLVKVLGGEG